MNEYKNIIDNINNNNLDNAFKITYQHFLKKEI